MPASVVYYQTGSVNLLEIWQHLATLINGSSNPQQIEQFNSWVQSLEDTLHLNLEKDLLSAFDQEIAIACETRELRYKSAREKSAREDFPVFILFQVKDQDGFAHTFQKVSTALQIEPQTEVYQTTEIQSLLLPGKIAPLTVYTAIVKDFCVVSLSRTVLQEVITASQQGNSLATTADYRQLSAYFPASGYAKGYINLKKFAGLLRNFLNQLDQTEPSGQDQTADLALNLTALAEQFPGMMWMTTVVRDGLLTESFSPVGGTVVGITLAWLGLSLFMD